ncbi:hypothetical protein MCOR25_005916 [Pyricularia grisea]|nr:hypothetical protein MCOR25_005916 [Pyricularia grisea]
MENSSCFSSDQNQSPEQTSQHVRCAAPSAELPAERIRGPACSVYGQLGGGGAFVRDRNLPSQSTEAGKRSKAWTRKKEVEFVSQRLAYLGCWGQENFLLEARFADMRAKLDGVFLSFFGRRK